MGETALSCQVCRKDIEPPEVAANDMQLFVEVNRCCMNIFIQFRQTGGKTLTLCSECAAFALGAAAKELSASDPNKSGFIV